MDGPGSLTTHVIPTFIRSFALHFATLERHVNGGTVDIHLIAFAEKKTRRICEQHKRVQTTDVNMFSATYVIGSFTTFSNDWNTARPENDEM